MVRVVRGSPGVTGNLTNYNSGAVVYSYDDENQLTWAEDVDKHKWATTFVYDGLGRLRSRWEYTWSGSAWTSPGRTYYLYDGRRVIQERDANNTPVATYTRGWDLSGTRQGAGGIGGLLALTRHTATNAQHYYYHGDRGGNITALVNAGGSVVARYLYDPFGNLLAKSGPLADFNRYRFSSKEIHPNSGLYYFAFRFYEPKLQRWLNQDPIGEAGGINLYAYVANNPINEIDPFGLWTTDIHNQLIDAAFPNLTPGQRQILKDVSAEVDSLIPGQLQKNDYQHAMSKPGEDRIVAAEKWTKFLQDQQDKARRAQHSGKVLCGDPGRPVIVPDFEKALGEIGKGLHALSDSTSPSHRGFQEWHPSEIKSHHDAEKTISPQDLQTTVDLMRQYYQTTFGQKAW